MIVIRLATVADLATINSIYNHFVATSTCTYQTEPSTEDERAAWFEQHDAEHPVTVAEVDGAVVGWGSLNRFHPRAAYGRTVENSIYVHHEMHRQGIGRAILVDQVQRARELGHHSIIAVISADQEASIRLHVWMGFREAGRLAEAGLKFGRWLDVAYYQLML